MPKMTTLPSPIDERAEIEQQQARVDEQLQQLPVCNWCCGSFLPYMRPLAVGTRRQVAKRCHRAHTRELRATHRQRSFTQRKRAVSRRLKRPNRVCLRFVLVK